MEPAPGTAASIAAELRGGEPLEEGVERAAAAARAALHAAGIALVIDRDGRRYEGTSGTIGAGARLLPLLDGEVRGGLTVSNDVAFEAAQTIATLIAVSLSARFLEESAQIDGLTRVLNRRAFDARLLEEWQRASRAKTSLTAAMIDVDYFKGFNDRRGHQAGDDVLRRVAQAAAASLQRGGDRFARYGGEEFVFVLPETELAGAVEAAERIRTAVMALDIPHPLGKAGRVTVSIGVAAARPSPGDSADALLAAADAQLYAAKEAGRNRVAAAGYTPVETSSVEAAQPLTALVGRGDEMTALAGAFDERRLVTLTGPLGVGKTRLALAYAQEHAGHFARVIFVDLAGVVDAGDATARIRSALAAADALVVCDGCEQVAAECAQALSSLPERVRVLATSRVPLGAPDELAMRIHPLERGAVRELFERHAAVAAVLVDAAEPTTAKLLRRLGGSPLEIKRAVAQLRTASTEQLLERGDAGDQPLDRATLTSLLAQAVAALEPAQKTALAAVSVFAGPFGAPEAAAVIPIEGIDAARAAELLAQLAASSLLHVSGDGRYLIVDPVRAASMETAGAGVVRERAVALHLRWCSDRVDEFDRTYGTVENQSFIENVAPLAGEFRVALDRAVLDERLVTAGIVLCLKASRYWFASGATDEARERCDAFLDVADGQDPILHVKLYHHAMRIAFASNDISAMERYGVAAERLIGKEDRHERATVLNYLGVAAKLRGEYDVADARYRECLAISRRVGYRRGEAVAQGSLGNMAMDVRVDLIEAEQHFATSASIFREIADDLNALIMTANRAEALAFGNADDVRTSCALAAEAAAEASTYGYAAAQTHSLRVKSFAALRAGDLATARLAASEAFGALDPEHAFNLGAIYGHCALVAAAHGEDELAAELFGAAEAADAKRAMPTHPIERFRSEAAERELVQRMGPAYAVAFARGRTLSDQAVAAAATGFLAHAGAPA